MPKNKTQLAWKEYENLIHKIYQELEPIADVKLNDFIHGIESNSPRQIDISIKKKIASHEILIIIQAKNLKRKADINVIGEFDSVIRDVRASKGILICNSGFTNTAKEFAKNKKIDICSVHDAKAKNWKTEIQIPVLKKTIKVKIIIRHRSVILEDVSIHGVKMQYPYEALMSFLFAWENDHLDKTPGTHIFKLERDSIKVAVKSMPIETFIEYSIEHRCHFKFFIPVDYRGVKDLLTQKFTPSFIEFNEEIPFLNDGTWKYVPNPSEISVDSSHLEIEIIDFSMMKKKWIRSIWRDE